MMDKEKILAGLRAIEDYRAAHRKLHDSWTAGRGIAEAHDPLIARMNARLNGLGFDSVESLYKEIKLRAESAGGFPRLKTKPIKILRVRSIGHDEYQKLVKEDRPHHKGLTDAITIGGQTSHSVTIPADVDPNTLLDVSVCEANNIIILQDKRQCGVLWSDKGGVILTIKVETDITWGIRIVQLMFAAQRAALESLGAQNITQQQAFMDTGQLTERSIGICVDGRKVGGVHDYDKPDSWAGDPSTVVCFTHMSLTMDYGLMAQAIRGVSNATELMLDEISLETQIGRIVTVDEFVDALLPQVSRVFDVEFQEVTLSDIGL